MFLKHERTGQSVNGQDWLPCPGSAPRDVARVERTRHPKAKDSRDGTEQETALFDMLKVLGMLWTPWMSGQLKLAVCNNAEAERPRRCDSCEDYHKCGNQEAQRHIV